MPRPLLALVLLTFTACGTAEVPDGGSMPDTDAGVDAGATDAGVDAGATDAGATDAGTADASVPDTWSNFGQRFFATYCVACHSGGLRDYRTITQVQRDFAHVRCGVSAVARTDCGGAPAPRQFPAGSGVKPTDPERARLVAWIDSGLAP